MCNFAESIQVIVSLRTMQSSAAKVKQFMNTKKLADDVAKGSKGAGAERSPGSSMMGVKQPRMEESLPTPALGSGVVSVVGLAVLDAGLLSFDTRRRQNVDKPLAPGPSEGNLPRRRDSTMQSIKKTGGTLSLNKAHANLTTRSAYAQSQDGESEEIPRREFFHVCHIDWETLHSSFLIKKGVSGAICEKY